MPYTHTRTNRIGVLFFHCDKILEELHDDDAGREEGEGGESFRSLSSNVLYDTSALLHFWIYAGHWTRISSALAHFRHDLPRRDWDELLALWPADLVRSERRVNRIEESCGIISSKLRRLDSGPRAFKHCVLRHYLQRLHGRVVRHNVRCLRLPHEEGHFHAFARFAELSDRSNVAHPDSVQDTRATRLKCARTITVEKYLAIRIVNRIIYSPLRLTTIESRPYNCITVSAMTSAFFTSF